MTQKIELLAPGGDLDSIKAAIAAGADAIYCGIDRFNARNRAENISLEQLTGILRLAHKHKTQVFLTLNIIIVEHEIPAFVFLLNKLINTSIDGIIIQDLGMLYLVKKYFKELKVHGSTQLTTHNNGQIDFLSDLGVTRVNLSRELNRDEIQELTRAAHKKDIMTEVFVHGSNCLSFSGLCYISSVLEGKSGNRGRCGQPCRSQYITTAAGKNFPLNLKDNCAFDDLADLAESGVDSIKIEGRIKKFHYVYTVVATWRKHLQNLYEGRTQSIDNGALHKVFNRDFSNGFLAGTIHRNMFIDNPRDNSAIHLAKTLDPENGNQLDQAKRQLYDEKTAIIVAVQNTINEFSIDKTPLTITCAGKENTPLKITIETPDDSTTIISETNLRTGPAGENTLNLTTLKRILKSIMDTEYFIDHITLDDIEDGLQLPFKELTALKMKIFTFINNAKQPIPPVTLPRPAKQVKRVLKPSLSLLIDSEEDLSLSQEADEVYFQLPNCLDRDFSYYEDLFKQNQSLIPWFPAVLIGKYYDRAVDLLHKLKPKKIVTNNSGIAYAAYNSGIDWVAGPHLNIVNSYSLLCLKEAFNCSGAFISNELSYFQIRTIKAPEDFRLYYSMYHPIILMTSRQCLFHQVTGCEKSMLDSSCIKNCQKRSSIETLNKSSIIVEKTKANYHTLYNDINFLNTEIASAIPNMFNSFFIDLRDIETHTTVTVEKRELVQHFSNFIKGVELSDMELRQRIDPTTHRQYLKGL
ncbi:MAG: putative protease [Desulforhopalus sp.]|jgi:putative protease